MEKCNFGIFSEVDCKTHPTLVDGETVLEGSPPALCTRAAAKAEALWKESADSMKAAWHAACHDIAHLEEEKAQLEAQAIQAQVQAGLGLLPGAKALEPDTPRRAAMTAMDALVLSLARRLIGHIIQATDMSLPDATDIELSLRRIIGERDGVKARLAQTEAREAAMQATLRHIVKHATDEKPPETAPPRNRLQNIVCLAEAALSTDAGGAKEVKRVDRDSIP